MNARETHGTLLPRRQPPWTVRRRAFRGYHPDRCIERTANPIWVAQEIRNGGRKDSPGVSKMFVIERRRLLSGEVLSKTLAAGMDGLVEAEGAAGRAEAWGLQYPARNFAHFARTQATSTDSGNSDFRRGRRVGGCAR